jgi:hypothetical protein
LFVVVVVVVVAVVIVIIIVVVVFMFFPPEMNRTDNKTVNALDARQQKYGGMDTPAAGAVTDIKGFSLVREQVLGLKLDKMSDSVSGQTVVDPRGFLTDLNSLKNPSQAEIGDIKKARLLLKSMITTNPNHGMGWIAAARLEAQVRCPACMMF